MALDVAHTAQLLLPIWFARGTPRMESALREPMAGILELGAFTSVDPVAEPLPRKVMVPMPVGPPAKFFPSRGKPTKISQILLADFSNRPTIP